MQSKVLKLVDISYGGENGFNQAIELSTEVLSNVKFIQEKKLIGISEIQLLYCEKFLYVCMYKTRLRRVKEEGLAFLLKSFSMESLF